MTIKYRIKLLLKFIGLLKLTILSCIRIIIYSTISPKIKKIKTDRHSECYILGNGPSLKENIDNDSEFLKTKELFVVNDFAKSNYFEIFKPKFYVLLDPCYWSDKVFNEYYNNCQIVLKTIQNKTNWPLLLMVPNEAIQTNSFQTIFKNNKYITLINYNSTSSFGFNNFNNFIYKNQLGIPPVNNVVGASIFLALNMKYKEINLLGTDHSWTQDLIVNDKNQVCHADPHFFDTVNNIYRPFIDVYGQLFTMHQILRNFALMFEGYHTLRKYSESLNANIYNRCKNSFIDAFEKKIH